jgi:hypothetical protein
MGQSGFQRWSGIALISGGALTLLINLFLTPFLPQHAALAEVAALPVFPWRQGASALAMLLLLFGCVGLYQRQAGKAGSFGAMAFIIAFVGTALALSIEWNETFLVRDLAFQAPDALRALDVRHGMGPYDVGTLIALGCFAIGWIMLAVSTILCGGPRWAAGILIVGFFLNPLLSALTHGATWALVIGACIPGVGWLLLGKALHHAPR